MKKITIFITMLLCSLGMAQNHSLNFDGVDDYVDLGQNFNFDVTDSFTIEAWINLNDNTSFQQIIAKLGNGALSFRGWGLQTTDLSNVSAYISTEFLQISYM